MRDIQIRNARTHNLKHIDIDIPKGKMIVVTGVSGSGKSSLIYDTLYKEGRNLYLSFIAQIDDLEQWKTVDSIKGLSPIIAVEQKILRLSNPRSTIGTKTYLNALIRSLYISDGVKPCLACGMYVRLGYVCAHCQTRQSMLHVSQLNPNSLKGICLHCMGRGYTFKPNASKLIKRVIPKLDVAINHILSGWLRHHGISNHIDLFYRKFNLTGDNRISDFSDVAMHSFVHGIVEENREFIGLMKAVSHYERMKVKQQTAYEYQMRQMGDMIACEVCNGYKLNQEALKLLLAGYQIGALLDLSMVELEQVLMDLVEKSELSNEGIQIVKNIKRYTQNLINVGLSYLSANRPLMTLSGGEAQRLMLMSHLQSNLESVVYVFDEPTAGLHEMEKERLIEQLYQLKNRGNTVIVVEHDKRVIERAEYIIDIGPLAGNNGGYVVYCGDFAGFRQCSESLTSSQLTNVHTNSHMVSVSNYNKNNLVGKQLFISDASTNNLKGVSVQIPLGRMVGIAGVSGSGKSSLISHTLAPLLRSAFHYSESQLLMDIEEDEIDIIDEQLAKNFIGKLVGAESLQGFAEVTQLPIGRVVTSIPLTYLKIWDHVRKLFASMPKAKDMGFKASSFSFNSEGACQMCQGRGYVSHRVGDRELESICSECKGTRYDREILQVTYKGYCIADILNMNASEGASFFADIKSIYDPLHLLNQVGMGYIRLGQPSFTLSGGEAQRIKLVKELGKKRKGAILYILDEPTTGLSMHDAKKLMNIFQQLIAQGHSLIICEHDINVLSNCDWIIELGPYSGCDGGEIIAEGTPTSLVNNKNSKIGPYLISSCKRGEADVK